MAWSRIVSVLVTSLFLSCLSRAADAQIRFDLPPQSLAQALMSVGNLANLNVYFDPSLVDGHQAPALKADLTVDEAFSRLLAGTKLRAVRMDENTVRVIADPAEKRAQSAPPATGATYSSGNVHLAYAGDAQPTDTQTNGIAQNGANSTPGHNAALAEVVVSAEKREERLQDVPVPVTALSANTLIENNQVRLQDYYTNVPGLTVTPRILSDQILSIRGITTGGSTNPTVGVTVDDVPYGSSSALAGGLVVPDIDPGDLQRVEVLRGPQGTLYGANSMGGLLKFVTVNPTTDGVSGRVQGGISSVSNGNEIGYNVRGSVNLPVTDTLALRASAFTREDPGYIDNPIRHIDGVNEERVSGARLAGLWKLSPDFSVKLSALYQDSKGDGASDVDVQPGLGDLQQNYLTGIGAFDRKVQAYSAIVNAKFAGIDLTAVSGYNINQFADSWDYSYLLGPVAKAFFGVTGSPVYDHNRTSKFSQEIRLTGNLGSSFDWLVGGFYTHELSPYSQAVLAVNSDTGVPFTTAETLSFPTTYAELAGFADLTYHITDQFDIQFGGRESRIRQSATETETGPYTGKTTPTVFPEVHSRNSAFTYLVTPRLKLSPDLMVYARLASGYRAGGPNLSPGGVVPEQYNPDKTQNYDLGVKADFLDHLLSVDAAIYYIDWKDIQVQSVNPLTGLGYNFNGSRAKSQGAELSVNSQPLTGLNLSAWVAFNDAVLTEPFPAASSVYGADGNRLPYSARFSGNVSIEQNFPLTAQLIGYVGGTLSYVGDRLSVFTSPPPAVPPRQDLPAYAKTDLRAGARYESWTLNLFVTNVADRRGLVAGGLGEVPPFAFTVIQPRTVGLSVVKSFP